MINIVIADDNIQNIQYIINTIFNKLENVTIRTFVATTSDEVFNLIKENNIDILILNIKINFQIGAKKKPIIIENYKCNINKVIESIFLISKRDIAKQIDKHLSKLGYNFKLKGTKYLSSSILYIYNKKDMGALDNLEQNVYKQIAINNNKTINNVKTSITKATEFVYTYQDRRILDDYFSISIKITPKLVISTILNKIYNQ